ncbi:putative DnaJ domain-containing protein [Lupinus albus]|uniref:Putative DnaJ domain-containing protein n=1 Tax=Lupinus albus TaxID=3870 RepID=A0A6A4P1G1_LUPAL|nr:putative DnaJ domain-containing protein [Lupinus albus]
MTGTLNMSISAGSVGLQKKCRHSTQSLSVRAQSRLYEVLQIKQNASAMEIKAAYRSLAKVYHPDSSVRRSEWKERVFIEIHDAYETLSDPAARAMYDLSLTGGQGVSLSINQCCGLYQTRNWETDQCW